MKIAQIPILSLLHTQTQTHRQTQLLSLSLLISNTAMKANKSAVNYFFQWYTRPLNCKIARSQGDAAAFGCRVQVHGEKQHDGPPDKWSAELFVFCIYWMYRDTNGT